MATAVPDLGSATAKTSATVLALAASSALLATHTGFAPTTSPAHVPQMTLRSGLVAGEAVSAASSEPTSPESPGNYSPEAQRRASSTSSALTPANESTAIPIAGMTPSNPDSRQRPPRALTENTPRLRMRRKRQTERANENRARATTSDPDQTPNMRTSKSPLYSSTDTRAKLRPEGEGAPRRLFDDTFSSSATNVSGTNGAAPITTMAPAKATAAAPTTATATALGTATADGDTTCNGNADNDGNGTNHRRHRTRSKTHHAEKEAAVPGHPGVWRLKADGHFRVRTTELRLVGNYKTDELSFLAHARYTRAHQASREKGDTDEQAHVHGKIAAAAAPARHNGPPQPAPSTTANRDGANTPRAPPATDTGTATTTTALTHEQVELAYLAHEQDLADDNGLSVGPEPLNPSNAVNPASNNDLGQIFHDQPVCPP